MVFDSVRLIARPFIRSDLFTVAGNEAAPGPRRPLTAARSNFISGMK
jgi:hypothetical protein